MGDKGHPASSMIGCHTVVCAVLYICTYCEVSHSCSLTCMNVCSDMWTYTGWLHVFTFPFALFLLPLYSPPPPPPHPPKHTHTHNTHTDNRPPNITGQLTVRVNVNVSLEETYLAGDQDGDDIHTFILQVNIHCNCKLLSHDFC